MACFLSGTQNKPIRVGELDEEMVFEARTGETFVLGASTWRIDEITHDRVLVSPAPGEPGKMPFWHGDQAGRPIEFGRRIGALMRELRDMPRSAGISEADEGPRSRSAGGRECAALPCGPGACRRHGAGRSHHRDRARAR